MESLILAQDERWRYASYMQVERDLIELALSMSGARVSNAWVTCLEVWDNIGKPMLIPTNFYYCMVI